MTPAERADLLAFPNTDDAFVRYYTFSESDLAAIRQRRGKHNRLGFAVQLCYLRHPGFALRPDEEPPAPLLIIVGHQESLSVRFFPFRELTPISKISPSKIPSPRIE